MMTDDLKKLFSKYQSILRITFPRQLKLLIPLGNSFLMILVKILRNCQSPTEIESSHNS